MKAPECTHLRGYCIALRFFPLDAYNKSFILWLIVMTCQGRTVSNLPFPFIYAWSTSALRVYFLAYLFWARKGAMDVLSHVFEGRKGAELVFSCLGTG